MRLKGISKSYGDIKVFDNFNLEIEENKITAFLGASGCGKTTLLNVIADTVTYDGEVERASARTGYIFQNQRLLPNLTVAENIEFVLASVIKDKKERARIIDAMLAAVELSDRRNAYPKELSGGMAQRVAMARAFAYPAELILMDEPFTGLDYSLKKRLISVFLNLYATDGRTVVFVSHDVDDALMLCDRIVLLGKGGEIKFDKVISSDKKTRTESSADLLSIKMEIYGLL